MSDIYYEKAWSLIVLDIPTTLLQKWEWSKTFSKNEDGYDHTGIQRVHLH